MATPPEKPAAVRFFERRVERKGLRPRVAAAVIAIAWLIAIVIFGIVEHLIDPDTFGTIWWGMWWATQTVTTVGYGDVVPQDAVGQLVASVLMIGGLSLFAVVTGSITSLFVTRAQAEQQDQGIAELELKLDDLAAEIKGLREQLAGTPPGSPPAG
jgi:voltage-gated potassium channel